MPMKVRSGLRLFAPACALMFALLAPIPGQTTESGAETSTRAAAPNGAPNGAKISQDQARQAAQQAVPGNVTDLTVETKRGKPVYVVEIVALKDGEETDVLVDMDTGNVIGVEH